MVIIVLDASRSGRDYCGKKVSNYECGADATALTCGRADLTD